jgi:hypothetical protein
LEYKESKKERAKTRKRKLETLARTAHSLDSTCGGKTFILHLDNENKKPYYSSVMPLTTEGKSISLSLPDDFSGHFIDICSRKPEQQQQLLLSRKPRKRPRRSNVKPTPTKHPRNEGDMNYIVTNLDNIVNQSGKP